MIGLSEIIVILFLIILLFISILPLILVVASKRVSGSTKALWIIIIIILSWLGFIIFLIANPKKDSVQ